MDTPLILPICSVQPDFQSSVRDVNDGFVPEEKFWVSFYKTGEDSVHGEVHVSLNDRDRNLVVFNGRKGISFKAGAEPNSYLAACNERGIPDTKVSIPAETFSDPLPQANKGVKISAFDIAPDGSQFAAGYDDGSVYIVPISPSSSVGHSVARRTHLSTITSLRFFPSSRVLLTSSADFSLSVLPADLPTSTPLSSDPTRITPVRTLKGHTRSVTSTAIIARGRTILSASKDATLRLWDVSSGTQVRTMNTQAYTSVNAISAGEKAESVFAPPPNGTSSAVPVAMDPREVETADKVVYCALSSGSFETFDLGTKLPVYLSPNSSTTSSPSLESIAYSPSHSLLATGSVNGIVTVYDTRSLGTPLAKFKRNGASIEDLAFTSSPSGPDIGLAIATSDGLPYVANVRPEGPSVRAELVGTDCDGVRCVRVGCEGHVWTAGDDGIVRQYEM
ncbi:WD40-repeat-containing domain protein [Cytidiella melzeri]|nr:WD40-repeat-containing domain protein [Cytidiella melzeri]